MILSGDAGATKTELAIFDIENNIPVKGISKKYSSKDFPSLENVVGKFLDEFIKDKKEEITSACIGVPGPVFEGKAISTNLDWVLDEKILSKKLNIKNFKLINDLEAMAYAVPLLTGKDFITLYKGEGVEKESNKVLLAPGTGLGQAALIYAEGKYNIVSTEGGHTDFAPNDDFEIDLLKYLQKKFGHVSIERVASGEGIVNIFNFLKDSGYGKVSEEFSDRFEKEDPAALISGEALLKRNKVCEKSLDIFISALGVVAGNMVLNYLGTGGVYLCGGIPIKVLDKLSDGSFVKSYLNKGRMKYILEMTPVYVIRDTSIGLTGAAMLAAS
jgi:glucokinase